MKPDDKKIWKFLDRNDDHWRKKKKRSEDYQTVDSVIDLNTAKQLNKLQNKGFLDSITGTIASGKESGVFLAELGPEGIEYCNSLSIKSPIVIKIFRTGTLNFKKILSYISGDVRFRKSRKKTRHIIKLWVEKEYRNLQRSSLVNINVPKPIMVKDKILLMELIGNEGVPYPLLKDTPNVICQDTLNQILEQTKQLVQKADLVHADLSAYNILMAKKTPYLIDMSQSVLISHPKALEFLKRDLNNIMSFFSIKGVDCPDLQEVFEEIIKDIPEEITL
jgi:RIO kinase 1